MAFGRIVGLLGLVAAAALSAACSPPPASTPVPTTTTPANAVPGPVTTAALLAPTTTVAPIETTVPVPVPPPTAPVPTTTVAPVDDLLANVTYVRAAFVDATDLPADFTGTADVAFDSPDDDDDNDNDLVTGRVYVPATRAAAPSCVALIHGYGDRASSAWIATYAAALSADGHAVLATNLRNHADRVGVGPFEGPNKAYLPAGMADIVADSAVDVRRGFDWMEEQLGCDKYAVVGYSMGGWVATIVAGADARVDGLVTLASGGNFDALLRKSAHDVFVNMSGRPTFFADFLVNENAVKTALAALRPVDPASWMSQRVSIPALTMWHSSDPIIPGPSFAALAAAAESHGGRRLLTAGVQFHAVNGLTSPGGDLAETAAYLETRLAGG